MPNTNNAQQKLTNKQIWDNFKRLDLIQIAKDLYGFQVDYKESYTKNDGNLQPIVKNLTHIKLFQPAWNGTEEKKSNVIFVRKNNMGEYFYSNVNSPLDKGSIIDFIANRNHLDTKNSQDMRAIANIIANYDGHSVTQTELPIYVPIPQTPKDRNAIVARFYKLLSNFERPEYLLARGIDQLTLNSKEFQNRIFNSVIFDKKGNQHVNISFPLVDKHDNLCGIEYKNVSFGGIETDSDRMLWRSNVTSKDNQVDMIVIGEAAIDIISYAQLNNLLDKNILFIGHAGNLYDLQIEAIQHLIDEHKPKQLVLVEDRDTAGYRYDIMLIGALNAPKNISTVNIENDFKVSINIIDKVRAHLIANLSFDNIEKGKIMASEFMQEFISSNSMHFKTFSTGDDFVTYGNNSARIRVEFNVSSLNMKKALDIVSKYRHVDQFIKIDKPLGSNLEGDKITDWNELLMTKQKIHKEDIPNLMYQFGKKNSNHDQNILKSNAFKPNQLLQEFIKNWEKILSAPQANAFNAGISIDMISYIIAKNQLTAFNNYLSSVQSVYKLDFVDFKEFEEFKRFIANNEEAFKANVDTLKSDLATLDNELAIVKARLVVEGDQLSLKDYNKLTLQKETYENSVKVGKKSVGQFNEYLDIKFLKELNDAALAGSKKVWDKTVKSTMISGVFEVADDKIKSTKKTNPSI